MKTWASAKVRRIVALRTRAAKLVADHERALSAAAPAKHHAQRLLAQAQAIKGTLTACEVEELRRAWSGV